MEIEEKAALALMQQIRALGKDDRRKEKKWEEGYKIGRGEEGWNGYGEEERYREDCGTEE